MNLREGIKTGIKSALFCLVAMAVVLVLIPIFMYSALPMPPGTNVKGTPVNTPSGDIRLLIDDTAWDPNAGNRVINQEIFDEILAMIDRADQFIYLDLFLWNPWQGTVPEDHRQLASELAAMLIKKKGSMQGMDILVLSDPINRIYGEHEPGFFRELSTAGIPVVFTDLDRLPDSNLIYAPYWSFIEKLLNFPVLLQWSTRSRFANPFDPEGPRISALQLGRLMRFKANHRKVVVSGSADHGLEMLVGSLNPADGSSAHTNIALHVKGKVVLEALESELAAVRWSIEERSNVIDGAAGAAVLAADSINTKAININMLKYESTTWPQVQWLTEGAIGESIIEHLDKAGPRDKIRLALFYLSEQRIVNALVKAVTRGASVRIVLDANRDAFGMKKIGVPNRPVAARLMKLSENHDIMIRWADTHGEQFHAKAMSITSSNTGDAFFTAGSANWTRRNVGSRNMEANLAVLGADEVTLKFNSWFDEIWNNSKGSSHTLPYEAWEEKGLKRFVKTGIWKFQERWGMGTF